MEGTGRPEQMTREPIANSEIAKIKTGQEVIRKESSNGLLGGCPTRYRQAEEGDPGQTADCDPAGIEPDAQEQFSKKIGSGD
jgi:hypothetical protein